MRPGDSMLYNGKTIRREKNKAFRRRYTAVHYVRILDAMVYRTKSDAMAAIDVAIRAREIRRQSRDENRGLAEIGSFIEYRGRTIERIADGADKTKRYRVLALGVFKSIDAAVAKIDFSVSAIERLENPPSATASGMNRNLEK